MIQALKLGFRLSSLRCFSPANRSSGEFGCPLFVSMKAVSKRLRSRSTALAAKSVEKASIFDMGESQKNASKASSKICSLIDESEEKENPAAVRTNSKRKVKELSESDYVVIDKGASISGAKRTKPQANRTSEDSVLINSLRSTAELELTIESAEIEGEKSVGAQGKISSRVATSRVKTHVNVEHSVDEPWAVLTHKKAQDGWTAYNPKTMRPHPITDTPHMKLISWNVNGLRAVLKLEGFSDFAQRENFDVLCLQETKLQDWEEYFLDVIALEFEATSGNAIQDLLDKNVDAIRQSFLEGYEHSYWTCSAAKLGYSGTAIISRVKPQSVRYGLGISDHDNEGRLVTVEFDHFYLLCGYVPNSSDGLKRLSYRITQWDPSLSNYMKDLERSKPVILTGDLNCAHQEMDIWNPAGNRRSAGFTDEERQSFQANFLDKGFVDTFRKQHPDKVGYTYWGYRHGGRKTNKGWRLDYFLASESIANQVYDSYILPDVGGSDHSPIGLILRL